MGFFKKRKSTRLRELPGSQPPLVPDYEHLEQAKFFAILSQINHPAVLLTFAVPNQAVAKMRSKATRIRFWKEGLRGGVSDTLCLHPGDTHAFLAMEFKRPGEKPRPDQVEFLERCRQAGGVAVVVFTAQEAFRAWLDFLGMEANYF